MERLIESIFLPFYNLYFFYSYYTVFNLSVILRKHNISFDVSKMSRGFLSSSGSVEA